MEESNLKEERQKKKVFIAEAVAMEKLNHSYCRSVMVYDKNGNFLGTNGPSQYGGVTVVWTMPLRETDNMITCSIATCSPKDKFDKVEGRFNAINNWFAGKCFQLRLPAVPGTISERLDRLFAFSNAIVI